MPTAISIESAVEEGIQYYVAFLSFISHLLSLFINFQCILAIKFDHSFCCAFIAS